MGAEFSKLGGSWSSGELHLQDAVRNVDVVVVGATTGLRAVPAGYVLPITTSATLTLAYSGQVITCSVDATILTLPSTNSTYSGVTYTIVNTAPPGTCEIKVLNGITTNTFLGGGWSSTSLPYQLTNSKATQLTGDSLKITSIYNGATPSDSCWIVQGLVGTWVSTT